ncbi:MAG: LysM peptidoglycan-binding domain-containing protein [Proteobacteria bacterium]|nr:LysM peptidoglycan-binding domain-containing protein [Pseudomonadota bacterium]
MSSDPKADFSDVKSEVTAHLTPNPVTASTASANPVSQTYTVVGGDSLSKIAKHFYGDANQWKKIFDANTDKIKNPDIIHPGQVLTIPAAPASGKATV